MKKNAKSENQKASDTNLNGEKSIVDRDTTVHEPEDQLQKSQDDLEESRDKYIRLYAEFENHKRRTAQEKINLIQNANEELLNSLLPIMDDFERAEKLGEDNKDREGFQLIKNKFRKAIEQSGVHEIAIPIGSDFDPDIHEAVTKAPTQEEKLKGKIMDVIEKGYKLHGKVIRYAKIVIGE